MAVAGKSFAAMLQRSTRRVSVLLSYAFLEWILIALLLLNSLFTYFIAKFAAFFSLQKPCLWCSRLDGVFERKLLRFSDLLCDSHAAEIARPAETLRGEKSGSAKRGDERFGSGDLLDDEDCLSSSSMFICYEKEAMEERLTEVEDGDQEKKAATMADQIQKVITEEEILSLRINVKKAVVTKLNNNGVNPSFHDEKLVSAGQRRDSGGAEDPASAVEQLRAALSAVYAELEEERSASAVAANETMAMITRLQDEKAAMQMEAVQYRRMMEEQSEYDQEALQLLNDLMVRRENEKRELERELKACRRIILDNDERIRERNDDDTIVNLEEIALDCANNMSILDESLTEFEEERISILDQLRSLEEKLAKLGDEDGEFAGELKPGGSLAKKLLPFLDAVEGETDEGSPALKLAVEEEVGVVYERLEALEADREFLQSCMSSVKKGDKGVGLLQEILEHLRDLRTIELHMRTDIDGNPADDVPVG